MQGLGQKATNCHQTIPAHDTGGLIEMPAVWTANYEHLHVVASTCAAAAAVGTKLLIDSLKHGQQHLLLFQQEADKALEHVGPAAMCCRDFDM